MYRMSGLVSRRINKPVHELTADDRISLALDLHDSQNMECFQTIIHGNKNQNALCDPFDPTLSPRVRRKYQKNSYFKDLDAEHDQQEFMDLELGGVWTQKNGNHKKEKPKKTVNKMAAFGDDEQSSNVSIWSEITDALFGPDRIREHKVPFNRNQLIGNLEQNAQKSAKDGAELIEIKIQ